MFLKALCHLCDVWTEDCEAWKVLHCSLTHLGSLSSWITWQSWNTQFTLSDSNSTSQHIEVSEEIKTWLDVVLLSLLKPSIPFLQQGRWDRTLRWGRNDLWDPRDRPLHEGRPCPAHPSSKHTQSISHVQQWWDGTRYVWGYFVWQMALLQQSSSPGLLWFPCLL